MQNDSEPTDATNTRHAEASGNDTHDRVDFSFFKLMNRYLSVWLWSIILGSSMTAVLSMPRPQEIANFGSATLPLIMILGAAYISYLACLYLLLNCLAKFIIPYVLGNATGAAYDSKENAGLNGFRMLHLAFQFLIFGIAFQAVLAIMVGVLSSAIRF